MKRLDTRNQTKKTTWSKSTLQGLKIAAKNIVEIDFNLYAHISMTESEIKEKIRGWRATKGNCLVVSSEALFEMSRQEIFNLKYAS